MPVEIINSSDRASDQPEALFRWDGTEPQTRFLLWPYRSLPIKGFVWFIGVTAAMLSLPLIALLGTAALWGVLPFLILAVAAIWWGLMHSYKSGRLVEELCLWPDQMSLVRLEPSGRRQEWQANPYWVRVLEHKKPVDHYLTLKGGEREVEIGAFLSPEERVALKADIETALSRLQS